MKRKLLAVAMLFLCAAISFAADSPSPISKSIGTFPDGLGVNIHFTDPRPGEMDMLAAAGFKWIRMDFSWDGTEKQKGEYDFSAFDRLMSALDGHHIRPIFILDYSNRNYDDNLSPHTDAGREAFAKWAAAAAIHFKGRGVVWEMYNEPNIFFWQPKPDTDDYTKLALSVGKALRKATPEEPYIGPACSTMDFKFLEACFKAGCLEYWSAVSVHPYRRIDPETVATDYAKLREMIKQYAPAGKQIPIVSGEWGYSSGWKNFDEERQGRYLPRELLTNLASGVPISIWYDWHDDGTDPAEPEHHFGTVHAEFHGGRDPVYDVKPAYIAMKRMADALKGCSFEKRVAMEQQSDWALCFHDSAGQRLAVWTTAQPHDATIPGLKGTWRQDQGRDGGELRCNEKGLIIQVSDSPQYIVQLGQ